VKRLLGTTEETTESECPSRGTGGHNILNEVTTNTIIGFIFAMAVSLAISDCSIDAQLTEAFLSAGATP
jgi:hypothetical protein